MARARIAALAAMVLILTLGATALAAPAAVAPGGVSAQAAVPWPTSTGLLVAEVVTGGASASDEYVELTNAASSPIDLAGLEVAYVTSTGSTVTRKASWATSMPVEPGRHVLIANVSGIFAAGADATYSGGFAATGGAIVLRPIGAEPIDAVAWGDATSTFVEGTSAPAPAAGSSIERRPGGAGGSSVDTNDNAADFVVNAAPVAEDLAAQPAPTPPPSPSPAPSASASPSASPTPTPVPTPVPTPTPTSTPTPIPAPTPTPTPTPAATPTPTPTLTPTPTATPHPTATATPVPSPTPTPAPSDAPLTVAAARATAVGQTVLVRGVVIAEAGRLGSPPLLAIADQTGGVAVKLPDGIPDPVRGAMVEVRGTIADPYGQVEIRPVSGGFISVGTGTPPAPIARTAGAVGEGDEGRLVRVAGTIDASAGKATSNDISFSITGTDAGTLRILADASSGLEAGLFRKGATVTLTGIVGQRASRKGALDGYRLWLRDRADVVITAQPAPTASPGATPRGGASPTPKPGAGSARPGTIAIRNALLRDGQRVTIEGSVTVGTGLLDTSGRRTIVEDDTAAIEVYLAAPDASLKPGTRLRVTGTVGQAWGAPRLRAEETRAVGSRRPSVHVVKSAPTAAVEWRLVRVSGSIVEVHRNGDRWTADLQVGGARVLISALAGSGIASTELVEGRSASITGIVKRPYPTATDRRFAIVPRQRADVALGRATPAGAASPSVPGSTPATGSLALASGALGPGAAIAGIGAPSATDIDLVDLATHTSERVRVGGLVTAIEAGGVRLDDGTAEARLVLEGEASGLVGTFVVGDALNATGVPEVRDEPVLVVATPDDVELVGDLGDAAAIGGDDASDGAAAADESVAPPQAAMRAVAAPGLGLDSFSTGIGTLVLLGISSVGVAMARRQRAQRLFRARIVARLEAIGRDATAPAAGPDPTLERPTSAPIGAATAVELGGNVRGSA